MFFEVYFPSGHFKRAISLGVFPSILLPASRLRLIGRKLPYFKAKLKFPHLLSKYILKGMRPIKKGISIGFRWPS